MAVCMTYEDRGPGAAPAEERFEHRSRDCSWGCWTWGAIIGLGGGVVTAALGSALTVISWFTGAGSGAQTAGTILLVLTIPLLVLGAGSLDLTEEKDGKEREARRHEDS